jgi:hypothetical protein
MSGGRGKAGRFGIGGYDTMEGIGRERRRGDVGNMEYGIVNCEL